MLPSSKISQTILEFGKPTINTLPQGYTKEELEAVLLIVITVWNAVTIDSWLGNRDMELKVYETLGTTSKEALLQVKRLVKRKKTKFGNDPRAVGDYWVKEKNGEMVFGCEANLSVENAPAPSTTH